MSKPVYALVGPDAFLQTQKLHEILAELPRDAQRIDVDGERAELSDVFDELRSFAMFGGTKVVVIGGADEFLSRFREQVENYVAAPSSSATLVLRLNALNKSHRIGKMLVKMGAVIPCEPPAERELLPWISNRARNHHKLALSPAAAGMLKELIGDDLGRLDNELAKLALQCEGGKVDVKDIETSVAFQREQEMWTMTDEIAAGQTTAALRRWRQLVQMDNSAPFRAVTWLAMWLEKAIKVIAAKKRGVRDTFQIGKEAGIFGAGKVEPLLKTTERLGESGVLRMLDLLVEIDYQSKSGVGDAVENVERFLLTVGNSLGAVRR